MNAWPRSSSVDMAASAMTSLIAAEPGGAQALEELRKESGKVSGLPVLQVTRVGMTVDGQPLAAPSVAPLPQSQSQEPRVNGWCCGQRGGDGHSYTGSREPDVSLGHIRTRAWRLQHGCSDAPCSVDLGAEPGSEHRPSHRGGDVGKSNGDLRLFGGSGRYQQLSNSSGIQGGRFSAGA